MARQLWEMRCSSFTDIAANPELCPLVLENPEPQQLFPDSQNQIADVAVLTTVDDNAIEIDDRTHRIKRTTLPGANIIEHCITHALLISTSDTSTS